ncbi:matrixin family metalloprotease [Algoriphagus sp. H41]|uniref:Matrixin family metalloprotease n=1 Tax=Algoriphagus oliviformis TaxID=2811231 RepID=A0ABS3C5V2_9BACT|nr:matrixin family metalloprotease [Algoriphagus oliviformis]MBN7812497.1 matrixin family metalloprotease [Algoriphagus oliviformis]
MTTGFFGHIGRNCWFVLALLLFSCKKYNSCNDLMGACAGNPEGRYCTFGFKWGGDNLFADAGVEQAGPGTSGGIITFGYFDPGHLVNTHSQTDVSTLSFSQVTACEAQEQIERALKAWSSVADFEFELVPVEKASIKFAVADIEQGGVAFPCFTDDLCSAIAGLVVLDIPSRSTCEGFYNMVLHEIGHALGLGHVDSHNIMNPSKSTLTELGSGDIDGMQSIYGKK